MEIVLKNYAYDINKDAVCFEYVVDGIKRGNAEITTADSRPFLTVLADLTREDHEDSNSLQERICLK